MPATNNSVVCSEYGVWPGTASSIFVLRPGGTASVSVLLFGVSAFVWLRFVPLMSGEDVVRAETVEVAEVARV